MDDNWKPWIYVARLLNMQMNAIPFTLTTYCRGKSSAIARISALGTVIFLRRQSRLDTPTSWPYFDQRRLDVSEICQEPHKPFPEFLSFLTSLILASRNVLSTYIFFTLNVSRISLAHSGVSRDGKCDGSWFAIEYRRHCEQEKCEKCLETLLNVDREW